jgi:hypothetical protein
MVDVADADADRAVIVALGVEEAAAIAAATTRVLRNRENGFNVETWHCHVSPQAAREKLRAKWVSPVIRWLESVLVLEISDCSTQ